MNNLSFSAWIRLACAALLTQAALAQAADLTVRVENVADNEGNILVGVFDSAAAFPRQIVAGKAVPAASRDAGGAMTVTIPDLPEGVYAVSVFHDKDRDTKLATNTLGIPTEPYGFNGKTGQFGPPVFDDIAFKLPAGGARVTVPLR